MTAKTNLHTEERTQRIAWLDVVRTIAIISITVNHAVNRSFAIYSGQHLEFVTIPLYVTIIKTVLYAFSRIGVPFFLMISGALLLPREYAGEGTKRFLKHNWLQLFITTELWLAIMFWYKQVLPGSILINRGLVICLIKFIMTLLFLNPVTMGSMWYMEMILCVYLMIPIISEALHKIEHRYFIIPSIIIAFCSFILPDINGVISSLGYSYTLVTKLESANIVSMYMLPLILGYFLSHVGMLKGIKTKAIAIITVTSFCTFCIFQFLCYSVENDFVVGESYQSIFPLLVSVFLFELISRVPLRSKIKEISEWLSKVSFGIYFVHICIMEGINSVLLYFSINMPQLAKFVILEIPSFLGAILIIEILRRERWIAKNLFGIK